MAWTEKVQYIDDLTGEEIEEGDLIVLRFSVNGEDFQIDTTEHGAATFEEAMAPFIQKGTKVGGRRVRYGRGPAKKTNLVDVRNWANANGFTVSDRGRLPLHVIEAYHAAKE